MNEQQQQQCSGSSDDRYSGDYEGREEDEDEDEEQSFPMPTTTIIERHASQPFIYNCVEEG